MRGRDRIPSIAFQNESMTELYDSLRSVLNHSISVASVGTLGRLPYRNPLNSTFREALFPDYTSSHSKHYDSSKWGRNQTVLLRKFVGSKEVFGFKSRNIWKV